MAGAYAYYEHDGAYFRREASAPGAGVREVLHGSNWVPYEGDDLMEPMMYGNRIQENDIPAGNEAQNQPANA